MRARLLALGPLAASLILLALLAALRLAALAM